MHQDLSDLIARAQALRREIDEICHDDTIINAIVPDSLRYILWRYETEHTGEDHQARVREARAWLADILIQLNSRQEKP